MKSFCHRRSIFQTRCEPSPGAENVQSSVASDSAALRRREFHPHDPHHGSARFFANLHFFRLGQPGSVPAVVRADGVRVATPNPRLGPVESQQRVFRQSVRPTEPQPQKGRGRHIDLGLAEQSLNDCDPRGQGGGPDFHFSQAEVSRISGPGLGALGEKATAQSGPRSSPEAGSATRDSRRTVAHREVTPTGRFFGLPSTSLPRPSR